MAHWGGGEDFGPAEKILKLEGVSFNVYLFELRDPEDSKMESTPKISSNPKIKFNVIPIGISGKNEIRDFNINKFELSSSLLQPSSLTITDNPGFSRWGAEYEKMLTWYENTELKEVRKVKTISVDEIVANGVAQSPEILSMDIQGIEVEALKGAEKALSDSVIAVTTESEFFEIYSGQGLFQEQLEILQKNSFRFVKFFGFQKWFPGPMVGHGFTTVTESLFLKYFVRKEQLENTKVSINDFQNFSSMQIFKTSLISYAYERYSYFYTCMKYLEGCDILFFNSIKSSSNLNSYVTHYYYIKENIHRLAVNPNYFIANPVGYSQGFSRKIINIFYLVAKKLIKMLRLKGLVSRTENHFGNFGEMQ